MLLHQQPWSARRRLKSTRTHQRRKARQTTPTRRQGQLLPAIPRRTTYRARLGFGYGAASKMHKPIRLPQRLQSKSRPHKSPTPYPPPQNCSLLLQQRIRRRHKRRRRSQRQKEQRKLQRRLLRPPILHRSHLLGRFGIEGSRMFKMRQRMASLRSTLVRWLCIILRLSRTQRLHNSTSKISHRRSLALQKSLNNHQS
jgi:hypothetical protein